MRIHAPALALMVTVAATAAPAADILEQILVKVNGDIITKSELEQRQVAAIRQRQPNQRPNSDTELQKALAEITPALIVDAVDELLLVQRGKELGYSLGNDQFQNIVENIKKENKIESEEQFQAALKQEGLTMEDLRRQLEKQMLFTRVQQAEVMGKISVTEEEVKQSYEANKGAFTSQPQLTLRELLVAVPGSEKGINVAQDDAAKEKADDIRRRLAAGEPFARLAADLSDSSSKANGGLIGPINQSDLSEELQTAIGTLQPGELTPVLRTPRGYQILQLESVVPATVKSMEEARAEIAEQIAGRKRQGELERYLDRLRGQAIIDWKNDEMKKAYELGLQQRQRAPQG
jgi:peptidyl-prolyl cis-trans isomerase SurA